MQFIEHIHKDNLHHAYLIESADSKVRTELLDFFTTMNSGSQNPDFFEITLDALNIKDARMLKSMASEKGFSEDKKIFLINTNHILREAQNAMLKIFEEPIQNTHFFIIVPDLAPLLNTFKSRFYIIKLKDNISNLKEAEAFIKMNLSARINYNKEHFSKQTKEDEDEGDEDEKEESTRTKALVFLNALEEFLYKKFPPQKTKDTMLWDQILQVRKFLNQPGSSVKNMMDSIALSIPNL